MYYVYLLQSQKDKTFYIGQTKDIESRLRCHNLGKVSSTKPKRPWKLVKYETYESRSESMWREYQLKTSAHQRNKFYNEQDGV